MIDRPTVSVIVVSHGRPALLRRALTGIGQLFYRPFEVVVVADDAGLAAIADLPFADRIKTARQDRPNISAARNAGAALSGGEILAFIDDDAVPEPTWLDHLIFPLLETGFAASTGTVLGRNGITVQWSNRMVDAFGDAAPVPATGLPDGHAIKLEGTNMAIRREALVRLGGFDEGFAFYLDETDVAFRLWKAGLKTALAPLATVHHGYAASQRRRADRVPLSLREIGESSAVYLRKHAPDGIDPALEKLRQTQASRVTALRRSRRLDDDVASDLLAGLEAGIAEGLSKPQSEARTLPGPAEFMPALSSPANPPIVLSGRWFSASRVARQARAAAADGTSVSLFVFDHTIRAHRVEFTQDGVWLQSGGLFGPSDRDQRRFTGWSFSRRISAETGRLEKIRWISGPPTGHTG